MTDYKELTKRLYNSDWNVIDIEEAAKAITQLTHDLADMTADRDSWYQQQSDRVDDAVRFAKERDEARAEVERITRERDAAYAQAQIPRMPTPEMLTAGAEARMNDFRMNGTTLTNKDCHRASLAIYLAMTACAIDAAISASNQEVAK